MPTTLTNSASGSNSAAIASGSSGAMPRRCRWFSLRANSISTPQRSTSLGIIESRSKAVSRCSSAIAFEKIERVNRSARFDYSARRRESGRGIRAFRGTLVSLRSLHSERTAAHQISCRLLGYAFCAEKLMAFGAAPRREVARDRLPGRPRPPGRRRRTRSGHRIGRRRHAGSPGRRGDRGPCKRGPCRLDLSLRRGFGGRGEDRHGRRGRRLF